MPDSLYSQMRDAVLSACGVPRSVLPVEPPIRWGEGDVRGYMSQFDLEAVDISDIGVLGCRGEVAVSAYWSGGTLSGHSGLVTGEDIPPRWFDDPIEAIRYALSVANKTNLKR